jgi:hypothetical protein
MPGCAISLDLIAFNAAKDVRVLSSRADEAKQIVPPSKEVMRELIELADEKFKVQLIATRYEKTDQSCRAIIHLVGSAIAIR